MKFSRAKTRFRSPVWLILLLSLGFLPNLAFAAAPSRFISRGPGGGGAFFGPEINPFNPDDLWIGSDMSDLFHSTDFGRNWDTIDFRILQGGSLPGRMEFTSNPLVRYALNDSVPTRTFDGGSTWTSIPPDSYSVYCLYADPLSTNRLLVSDYTTLKISTNSGATYKNCYTNNDLLVAGAFWDGTTIYVGTRPGMLVSSNGGGSFTLIGTPGIPATESMVSFTGAKEGGALRFFCVTLGSGDVYPGVQGSDYANYHAIYRLDGGSGTWTPVTTGVGGNYPFFVAMCRTNINVAYAAGSDSLGQPVVLKTLNGGSSWSQVMQCTANANVATGWTGDDSGAWNWKKWSFGECAMGFAVCQSDLNRAVITDFGFIHATTNGGTTWQQAYDWPGCQSAVGAMTPKTNFFTGSGAEDTSCWSLSWFSSNTLFCSFTDIRGMLSTNSGSAWMSPLSLSYNSTYQTLKHPTNGLVYGAMSSVHDMYAWDKYCQDSAIDGGLGAVMYSTNQGFTWATFKNLGKPIVALALDPNNANRLYASMVNSTNGGIYRTVNLNAGTSATWTKLGTPPRAQGHAYNIYVLNDGTLVASYSARIASSDFQPSSGVFVSMNDGTNWVDRSATGMQYYTKDLTIDPNDPAQNTWYAGVWGEWGSSSGLGGLYCTTNRGTSWTRITSGLKAVGSCTVSPVNPDEMYVTTEDQGLWYSSNRRAASPAFAQVMGYPFRFPSRVFYNPYDSNEIWVTSYGNGMRLGRVNEPRPVLVNLQRTNQASSITIAAAPGQRVVLSASSNFNTWTPIATNVMYTGQVIVGDTSSAPARFFRASVP
jgi:photosystem II stability/assembly factor-like uncharacterized protein